jgi:hypothetical protein
MPEVPAGVLNEAFGYLITTDKLGKGSDDLGRILMKSFLYTLSEKKPYRGFKSRGEKGNSCSIGNGEKRLSLRY